MAEVCHKAHTHPSKGSFGDSGCWAATQGPAGGPASQASTWEHTSKQHNVCFCSHPRKGSIYNQNQTDCGRPQALPHGWAIKRRLASCPPTIRFPLPGQCSHPGNSFSFTSHHFHRTFPPSPHISLPCAPWSAQLQALCRQLHMAHALLVLPHVL